MQDRDTLDYRFETVDSIRFIKPNKEFYNFLMDAWLRFLLVQRQQIVQANARHQVYKQAAALAAQ